MPKTKCLLSEAKGCRYYSELEAEVKAHKITVYRWSSTSSGHAKSKGVIKIPKPQNEDRLGVAFHEIGHVALRHCDYGRKSIPRYIQEFEADMFMEELLNKYDLLSARVHDRTRWHCLSRIAMAVNRGLVISAIPQIIHDSFADIDIRSWAGKKIFVGANQDFSNLKIHIN